MDPPPTLLHARGVSEFRAQADRLLGDSEPPETLWVVHDEGTLAMVPRRPESHVDLSGHYDWLLASGPTRLGLLRLRGPFLQESDLVFLSGYGPLQVSVTDMGSLARSRHLAVVSQEGWWFAVTAHLTPTRTARVDQFTHLLLDRVARTGPVSSPEGQP